MMQRTDWSQTDQDLWRLRNGEGDRATAPIGPDTINRFTLSNGMRLLVLENHTTASVVLSGHLWAGGVNDPPAQLGLSAFTAGLLMRGTTSRSSQEIHETLESVAATVFFSGGRHLVSFAGKSLAEDLSLMLDVFTDALLHPTFPETELEKLRGLTITGLKELEDDTRGLTNREFRRLLFGADHPYGWPISGTLETVPTISREHVLDFYHTHYGPGDGVVVMVGDISAQEAYAALEQRLGGWQPAAATAQREMLAIEPLTTVRRRVLPRHNKTQEDIVWGAHGPSRLAPDYYAAWVGNVILGQIGLMGRVGQTMRDELGLAYYAYSSLEARLGPGSWRIYAGVSPDKVPLALESILFQAQRLRDELVSDEELVDSQEFLVGSLPLRLETNEGIAGNLSNMELYALGDDYLLRYPELIRSVTPEQVRAAAQKYLDTEVYALAIAGPYEEAG
jgi:zinc protease